MTAMESMLMQYNNIYYDSIFILSVDGVEFFAAPKKKRTNELIG